MAVQRFRHRRRTVERPEQIALGAPDGWGYANVGFRLTSSGFEEIIDRHHDLQNVRRYSAALNAGRLKTVSIGPKSTTRPFSRRIPSVQC